MMIRRADELEIIWKVKDIHIGIHTMKRLLWLILPVVGIFVVAFLVLRGASTRVLTRVDDFPSGASFSPDGALIAAGSLHDGAQIYNANDGTLMRSVGRDRINDIAWTPDSKMVLTSGSTAGDDGIADLWRIDDGVLVRSFETAPGASVYSSSISPDGKTIALAIEDAVTLHHSDTGAVIHNLSNIDGPTQVLFTPDGRSLIVGGVFDIQVFSVESGQEQQKFAAWATVLAVSPDGRFVAAPTDVNDSVVQIWDIATGQPVQRFAHDDSQIHDIAFSPDGRMIVTGSQFSVKLWRLADGAQLRRNLNDDMENLMFSPDSSTILIGAYKRLSLWSVADANQP